MNLKTNTRTFGKKKKNTHPDKRARVENDKFCVFISLLYLLLFICLFVCLFCFLAFTSDSIIQFEKKKFRDDIIVLSGATPPSLNFQFSFNNRRLHNWS